MCAYCKLCPRPIPESRFSQTLRFVNFDMRNSGSVSWHNRLCDSNLQVLFNLLLSSSECRVESQVTIWLNIDFVVRGLSSFQDYRSGHTAIRGHGRIKSIACYMVFRYNCRQDGSCQVLNHFLDTKLHIGIIPVKKKSSA